MFDFMLNAGQLKLAQEVTDFVKHKVSKELILDMDAEKITYPKEYMK
ncbi:MAG: hypothetical protein M0Z55_10915 [Peptococcaceae bacterium]|nr:hypothetical protein [Peptococcaceae bacterium]